MSYPSTIVKYMFDIYRLDQGVDDSIGKVAALPLECLRRRRDEFAV
jgi:hypothetical protein